MLVGFTTVGVVAADPPSNPLSNPPTLDGPLSPDRAPESFRLEPGLRLELVAAEPLVVSPVAMAFDERGRLFVVENRGYPTGPGEGMPPAGRVVRLDDSDGDGRYDKRVEFATGLTFPNGVLPWDGGLIVTCAPDILFLKDTDDDGIADQRDVLLTGFSTGGSTQLRVSHPTLGSDGWVYVTSGLTGGKVTSPAHPDRTAVETRRTDLRFRPQTGEFEAADGGAQFGMSFDDFGRRFICYNRVQAQHVVTSSRYWRRNPQLPFADTVHNCPDDLAPEPLRGHGQAARLFPLSSNVTTADSHAGTFTAACAVTVWRGSNLPDAYRGGVFSCDPTGNLVHFDALVPQGATFAARRAREGMEFLASSDNWFRPVFLHGGPDGALYVCDMYRKTIEHPDYLPVEVRKHTDFESGKTMGRLWRVVKSDASPKTLMPRVSVTLADATSPQLTEVLAQRDGWWRDAALRLLSTRRDEATVAALRSLVANPQSPGPGAGIALQLLAVRQQLDEETLATGLRHAVAGVREQAIALVESRLEREASWLDRLLPLADDEDARVRFQAALTLGASNDKRVVAPLARIATRGAGDRWTRAASMSGVAGREREYFEQLVAVAGADGKSLEPALWSEAGRLLGASRPQTEWPELLELIVGSSGAANGDSKQFVRLSATLAGFGEAIRSRGANGEQGVLASVLAQTGERRAKLTEAIQGSLQLALRKASDAAGTEEERAQSLALLAHADYASAGRGLLALVDPQQSATVQSGAVRALGLMKSDEIAATLLEAERFRGYTPRLREDVLGALLSGPQHLPGLLAALESGAVPPNAIDTLRRRQLTEHRDAEIKARAAKVFASLAPGDRVQVYEGLKSVVSLTPNSENGRAVFKKTCAACHRLEREGTPVGPDLFGIRNQPKEAILLHIVIPEQEITQGFGAYVVTTHEGRILTGLLSAETPTSVTLRQSLGKEETILRSDIEQIVASKLSLMPQELEKQINRQEFADLLAYLKGEKTANDGGKP